MTNRGNVGGSLVTIAMTAALWAWSGGVASAQCEFDCPPPTPPGFVPCTPPPDCTEGCPQSSLPCNGFFTPDQKVNVFTFGTDNSLQVKFGDVCPAGFNVTVTLVPTRQTDFHDRLRSATTVCNNPTKNPPAPLVDDGLGTPEVTCNETVVQDVNGNQEGFCAVYHVSVAPTDYSCFGSGVEYLVGWKAPAKGNKHDYFLLRDPDALDTITPDDSTNCFIQNITDGTVIRNYVVGDIRDPGLGGRTCCPSDYVVVRQKIRPITKQD